MLGVTKSEQKNGYEIVIHIDGEYCLQISCEMRDALIDSLKKVYYLNMSQNLPIYGV